MASDGCRETYGELSDRTDIERYLPGVQGAFTVVELDEDDLSALVYVESWAGNMFLFGADEIWRGRVTYDYLRRIALSPADSLSLLDQMTRDL
jgi:hypothetical protein